MLIHLVKSTHVDQLSNNLWDKYIFLEKKDKTKIHNIIVKCNRNISVDPCCLPQLMSCLINDTTQLGFTEKHDGHGEFDLNNLSANFREEINENAPEGYQFHQLGIAVNTNLSRSNIEIKYKNLRSTQNEIVVVNLHLKCKEGESLTATCSKIVRSLQSFNQDFYGLAMTRALTLDNFHARNYRVAESSRRAYHEYSLANNAENIKQIEVFNSFRSMFSA